MTHDASTTRVVNDPRNPKLLRRKMQLTVLRGPDQGKTLTCGSDEVHIGTLPANDETGSAERSALEKVPAVERPVA